MTKMIEPVFELPIILPPRGSRDLLRAVHAQLRAAILDGRLQPGLRLPSTRSFAAAVGVSRNTAVAAYDLLLSEGYLIARPGAGTYVTKVPSRHVRSPVNDAAPDGRLNELWREQPPPLPAASGEAYRFNFSVGLPDKTFLPLRVWRRLSARALRAVWRAPAAYAEPQGRESLRVAIAKHISFARAVACSPEQIVVVAGAQQAFDLLARVLVTPYQTVVALEEPGYPPLRAAFLAARGCIAAIPVDGEGLLVERLPIATRVICVTPSHQFPLGITMSAQRRAELLDFAQQHGAVVIEDDYDGEFRLGGRPLEALQTLDPTESVCYVGSFSKSLFPELRLGFVVAPRWIVPALVAAKACSDWHCPLLTQEVLAAFIEEGHLARHVRKMGKVYAERRTCLLAALSQHCGDRLKPLGNAVGLHLTAELGPSYQASGLIRPAALAGIRLQPVARYAVEQPALEGLVLGFGLIPTNQINAAVDQLAQTMNGCR